MRSSYGFGFISRQQAPLFMVWREDYVDGEIVYATPVFVINTPKWIQKLVWRRLGWAGTV